HLATVLEREPKFALGHAVKGLMCLLLGRKEMTQIAREASAAAWAALDDCGGSKRCRHMIAALDAFLAKQPAKALAELEQILLAHPADSLAMKLVHAIRFVIGDASGMLRSVERVMAAHGEDHPARGYLLGCQAFALEENGRYREAEAAGLNGLTYTQDDAWGLHAVAHVMDMTHRPQHGIELIEANKSVWIGSNNFRFHVWWHKALLHLDRGEMDVALALYDQKIRAERTDDYRDIANASSLLVRLELEGVNIGERWEELADLAENRADHGGLVFADLHYMLALIGGERRQAADILQSQMMRNAKADDPMANIIADPGLAAVSGLVAFGEGRYESAFTLLDHSLSALPLIGGSHAQRDVFERITVDAGLRAGQLDMVEDILKTRRILRAGHSDQFDASRMQQIAKARALAVTVPAQ
ncbi:MAG: tetratricopeptide repeat protein, partial [Mangrovicoccus sp.]